jgi:hypothetical protein
MAAWHDVWWQQRPQRSNQEVMSRTIILYHKEDEILPYDGCSFHLAHLRSLGIDSGDPSAADEDGTAAAAASAAEEEARERTGVRCVELRLNQSMHRAAAHGDNNDDRGSPHNEWICGLPTWKQVAPMIRAALQEGAGAE